MYLIKSKQSFISIALLIISAQGFVLADGYRNTPEGARAVGAFGGHRAFADDANAVIHNSANMVDLEKPMIQFNVTGGYGHNTFRTAGGSDKTENPHYGIPGFSIAVPFKEGKYAVGLATYVPYGRSVDWGNKDYFAEMGYPYKGTMAVFDFTPNVAMRLTDSLSVGVGLDFYYGKVEQKQFIYTPAFFSHPLFGPIYVGTVTSRSELDADGSAVGWNAAVAWKMTEKQRLALTYRSSFTIDYKGDNRVEIYETAFSPAMTTESTVRAEIEYPTIIGLAYGIELTDTLRAEINAEWMEFSVYQNLTIDDSLYGSITSPQKLGNTWTFGIGGEWTFATNWAVRSGFQYLEAPTPDSTYGNLGPDENQGVVSIGLGYETEHHSFDIGYAVGLFDGRTVRGSANSPDGFYDYDLQVLTLSYGYKF